MTTTLPPAPPPALTTRETEVLALLAAGHDQPAIAARLHLGVDTVKTHTMRAPAVRPHRRYPRPTRKVARMNLRQWLAVPYDGPNRRRAAVKLWLRDVADGLADGPPGNLRWRWRLSLLLRAVYRR